MSFIKDFKTFALKGNVIDLAVAVIIGGAFGKIVTAVVDDIIMPLVSIVTGKGMFSDKFIILQPKDGESYKSLDDAKKAGANVFAYGHFIQTVVDFFIIALFIFIAIRMIAKMKAKEEGEKASAFGPSPTEKLLTEIRDLMQKDKQA